MTKTNQSLPIASEPQENFAASGNNLASHLPKNKSRRWKNTQPDIQKQCLICDSQFSVKYVPPKKQYSCKNNWGYWTKRESDKHKYLCNTCLIKLYKGNINNWIKDETRADVFYNYVKRGQF